jgi:regulator of sigma E protease
MGTIDILTDYVTPFIDVLTDYIIPFLLVLTVVVFVHELGHFLVARRNSVRIEVFSIGFGREILGWTDAAGTRWKVGVVPLGGYVKMFGEYDEDTAEAAGAELTPEDRAVSFHYKSLGQRSAIVAAGPIANFIFAIIVLTGIYTIVGNPAPRAAVGEVVAGSAAAEAGLEAGDRFLSIGGEEVVWFEDLRRIVQVNAGVPLSIVVARRDREVTVVPTPKPVSDGRGGEIGLLGVKPDPEQIGYERADPLNATWMAVKRSVGLVQQILIYLGEWISGGRSGDELRGPVGIAKLSGQICGEGPVSCVLFAAALSINLGLINLFPIPMLDGGHLVFFLAEGVRGRPLDRRLQEYSFRFGLILLIMIFVYATFNDLVDLEVIEFFKQLIT